MSSNDKRPAGRRSESQSAWLRFIAAAAGLGGIFLALAVALGSYASGFSQSELRETTVKRSVPAPVDNGRIEVEQYPDPSDLSRAFARVAEKVGPAVVNITTEQVSQGEFQHPRSGGPFDDFFERFFGGPMPQQRRRSLGSGVIIDPGGYILTNNHVVEGAQEITVSLSNDTDFEAEVVGSDPETDLAVIRIRAEEALPAAPLGDSERVVVGEWVLAMGNPFGFGHTITAGIISAKGRIIGQGSYDNFIQTDAAINPGNSGGPLVNMNGEVIGINSNIFSSNGGSMGIGFAIPSRMAQNIYEQLVSTGSVTRGWLGVGIQNLTPQLARGFGLEGKKGAVVSELRGDDSPAAEAGMEVGDVIVEIGGREVDSNNQLVHVVADLVPGESVEVKFYRDGKLQTTQVTLGKRAEGLSARQNRRTEETERGRLGVTARDLTEQLATQMGASSNAGVVLIAVEPEGPAAEAGLTRGDIIVSANRQSIRGLSDLEQVMGEVPGGGDLLLRVERVVRGNSNFLWIPIELQ
jgi:serine protease Do